VSKKSDPQGDDWAKDASRDLVTERPYEPELAPDGKPPLSYNKPQESEDEVGPDDPSLGGAINSRTRSEKPLPAPKAHAITLEEYREREAASRAQRPIPPKPVSTAPEKPRYIGAEPIETNPWDGDVSDDDDDDWHGSTSSAGPEDDFVGFDLDPDDLGADDEYAVRSAPLDWDEIDDRPAWEIALEAEGVDLDDPIEAPEPVVADPILDTEPSLCSNCEELPVSAKKRQLCAPCDRYLRDHDQQRPPRLFNRQRRTQIGDKYPLPSP